MLGVLSAPLLLNQAGRLRLGSESITLLDGLALTLPRLLEFNAQPLALRRGGRLSPQLLVRFGFATHRGLPRRYRFAPFDTGRPGRRLGRGLQRRGRRGGSRRFRIRACLDRICLGLGGRNCDSRVGLLFTRGSVRRDVEQQSVLHTHEQDRRRPLHVVLVRIDRLACLGHGRVDRIAIRQRGIELRREHDGRTIRDLELHADDGGNLALDQARRHAGEWILDRAATSLASVEHGQPKRDFVLQDRAQLDAGDAAGTAEIVFEKDDTVVCVVVVATMPDVMEDVIVGLAQLALQSA